MRSTTWKAYLGVLCLLASGTANAAKLSFSDKGFIDVGALLQTQFRMIENGSPDKQNPSYDFLFGRARLLVSGQFDDHIGFILNTDVTYGAATIGGPTGGVAWNCRMNCHWLAGMRTPSTVLPACSASLIENSAVIL